MLVHYFNLILAAFALAWPWKSPQDPISLNKGPGVILAAGEFGALALATCNQKPCQALWLRTDLESAYNRIPNFGEVVKPTISEEGYFIGYESGWFSTSPGEISKAELKLIQKKAREALRIE